MLQEIISGDGFVDPEILAELDEEQKQILFCKMREEQVRRYNAREKEEMNFKKKRSKEKKGDKHIGFNMGKDNKVWVWVMGDHEDDKSIDEMLKEEALLKANKEAENETQRLRTIEERELVRLKTAEDELNEEKKDTLKKTAKVYQRPEQLGTMPAEEKNSSSQDVQRNKLKEIKRMKELRRTSIKEIENMKAKRSSEIFLSIQEVRKKLEQEANKSNQQLDKEWKKQEEKAKRLENQMRMVARRVRNEWRRSISVDTTNNDLAKVAIYLVNKAKEHRNTSIAEIPTRLSDQIEPDRVKQVRPKSRAAIIQWYKESECSKGAGFDPNTNELAPWFHGPITREKAEDILEEKSTGSYLVRLSERIFGYAISYRAEDRCKHYLINALDGKYEFFGTNQISHPTLYALVNFHMVHTISNNGQELLKNACGQSEEDPDFAELFDQGEITYF